MMEPLDGKLKIECNYFYKYEIESAIEGLYKELSELDIDKESLNKSFKKWFADVY